MFTAQDILDEIDSEEDIDYNLDEDSFLDEDENIWEEVEAELQNSINEELTVPMEKRDVYWAQTLLDSVI